MTKNLKNTWQNDNQVIYLKTVNVYGMKEEVYMARSVTNNISKLLLQQKMTQKELAQASGITESAISHYVKGDRVPRGVNLMKIARALGTTADYILRDDERNEESDLEVVKTLIARNAPKMTKAEKMELVSILINED